MFGKRVRLFSIAGFEVALDPSWFLLAVLVAWSLSTGFFPYRFEDISAGQAWLMGVVGTVGLFLSIIAHELSHSLFARRTGISMQGITLFLFGGAAEMGDEPARPRDEFLIAIVGPLASIAIGAAFFALNLFGAASGWPLAVNGVLEYLASINVILAVFNLIPAYPLDGGRVLRAALWAWKKDLLQATRISSRVGWLFGALLIGLGVLRLLGGAVLGGFWLALIGLFVQRAATVSYRKLATRGTTSGPG
jgi:Zn-dependent protease